MTEPADGQQPGARGRLAHTLAATVRQVPGVAGLTTGTGVRAQTQLPGETVPGIVLGRGRVAVHIVVEARPIRPVADAVRAAVREILTDHLAPGVPHPEVDVIVADIEFAADRPAAGEDPAAAASRARRWRLATGTEAS